MGALEQLKANQLQDLVKGIFQQLSCQLKLLSGNWH